MLCAAVWILSMRKISMREVRAGMAHLLNYCRGLLLLGAELSINHHLAMHFLDMFKLFGPVYLWWLFAYERFNGMFEKVKLNGHDGGEMELTMMQYWVQSHLVHEYLTELPADAHPKELNAIQEIINTECDNQHGLFANASVANSRLSSVLAREPQFWFQYSSLNR
ncbi:hypothetical protein PM082_010053 [Marasmius tenuissimus]|nr:hypothetical protein PM082_010053 [Marasmius tenuissimus]